MTRNVLEYLFNLMKNKISWSAFFNLAFGIVHTSKLRYKNEYLYLRCGISIMLFISVFSWFKSSQIDWKSRSSIFVYDNVLRNFLEWKIVILVEYQRTELGQKCHEIFHRRLDVTCH